MTLRFEKEIKWQTRSKKNAAKSLTYFLTYLDSPSSCSRIVCKSFKWWLVFNFPPKPTKDEVEDVVDEGSVGGQVCLFLFCTPFLLTFFHDIQSEQVDVLFLDSFRGSSFAFEGDKEVGGSWVIVQFFLDPDRKLYIHC